VVFIMRYFTII